MAQINKAAGFHEDDMPNLDALLEGYGQTDETTVEQGGVSRPYFWHLNGDPKLVGKLPIEAQGRWAIEVEQETDDGKKLIAALRADPNWTEEQYATKEGPITLLVCSFIDFCEVAHRTQLVIGRGRDEITFPSSQWAAAKAAAGDEFPKTRMHQVGYLRQTGQGLLAMVTTHGSIALAIRKGMSVGIMAEVDRRLAKVLTRMAEQRLGKKGSAYCTRQFYVRIGHATDDKGKPLYSTVGQKDSDKSSKVTLPVWLNEDNKPWDGDATQAQIMAAGTGLLSKAQIDVSNADALMLQDWKAQWSVAGAPAEEEVNELV